MFVCGCKASEGNNILRLGTFLAVRNSELDLLAVGKGLEAFTFDGTEMNKNIRTIFLFDKSKTF